MTRSDQNKLLRAGFEIIRKSDYPGVCIKSRKDEKSDFTIKRSFTTKTERDMVAKQMLSCDNIIED
ncbi:MAG: hypothetical protein ACRCUJ_01650 [Phocaeicola sp.]